MQKLLTTNATDTSFAAKVPTITSPTSGTGMIAAGALSLLDLIFFGDGADNTTFDYRVIGWTTVGSSLWVPTIMAQGSATLSALVGVDGYPIDDGERLADTIDLDYGIGVLYNGLANAQAAHVLIGLQAEYHYLEVQFDMTGATSGNALWALT